VPNPKRSPLPLSSSQESQVRELYFKNVRTKCADEVRGIINPPSQRYIMLTHPSRIDFAACCTSRTFTATFMCRAQQKAMNTCMMQYATQAEHDAAREEWFATIDKRREQREQKEAKRIEDEKFWREWWDKDLAKKPGENKGTKA
jgi:COX assembly protein 1